MCIRDSQEGVIAGKAEDILELLEDIAKVLDENVNTVKSRLYRGLKKLRLELTDAWQWE